MGVILSFLGGKFGLIAVIAAGVVLAGSMSYGAIQHANASRYKAEVGVQIEKIKSKERDLSIVLRSNISKDEAIESQRKALEEWASYANERTRAQVDAVEALKRETAQRIDAMGRIKNLEAKDYELQDCAKYLAIDVTAVCPAHSRGVRERQAIGDNRPGGGSSEAGRTEGQR